MGVQCILTTQRHHTHLQPDQAMAPWDVPHQAAGSPAPVVNPERVTVYNMRFCPYAQRTILTLLAKNIPFDVVNINLRSKPDWFLQQTWGTVSVVRHKGKFIMESLINSDYIDDQFPQTKLHPEDPYEKAEGRLLLEKFTKFIPSFYKVVWGGWGVGQELNSEELQKHWRIISDKLEEMDAELKRKGTPFFGGDKPAMVDFMIWPHIERLTMLDLVHPEEKFHYPPARLEHFTAWLGEMWKVPAVKEYGLTPQQHMEFKRQMKEPVTNYDFLI